MVRKIPQPSGALAEMLAQDGEFDRILDGRGLTFESVPATAAQPPPPAWRPPPVDWEAERLERLEREAAEERERLEQEAAAELAKITDDGEEPETLPPKSDAAGSRRSSREDNLLGVAHAAGGVSRTYTRSGRLADAHMIRRLELDLPEPGLTVTLNHDDTAPIGEVVYAELDSDDRLNVVSVVDDDWTDVDDPVFYSGTYDCRSRSDLGGPVWIADRAYLIGMALTTSPASFEARPLSFMPGDIRENIDRFGWPCSWRWSAPLLERAVNHLPRGENRARRIVGPPPKIEQVGADAWLIDDELVARTGRPAGRVRYCPPAGDGSSILSVR